MPSSPTSEPSAPAAFVCECKEESRSACKGLPFYGAHGGKRYCVLHCPAGEKSAALFSKELKRKLDYRDFDFHGVWFPGDVSFSKVKFTSHARFAFATFAGKANFYDARFGDRANFIGATFEADVDFSYAWFEGDADFSAVFRALADFNYARFSKEAYFRGAEFYAKANFRSATFTGHARFGGGGRFGGPSFLDLQFVRVEKPEQVSFDRLALHPHWFVNADPRKFDFISVTWLGELTEEVAALKAKEVHPPHDLLAAAYRQLAVNAEENHRYEEASRFRYMAMEARRFNNPLADPFGFAPWTLHWWYWFASGYGERVWQAFVVLAGIWLLAAACYTGVGFVRWEPRASSEREAAEAKRDEVGQPLRWQRALTYSLGVMTLQRPEPRPATDAAQAVVMAETILGPVQAALLALAIRRKFMR